MADARQLQIEDWRQGENAKLEKAIDWFQYEVRQLVPPDARTFEETYGQKSRRLPYGSIGFRRTPAKVEVYDADKALAWAKAHGLETKVTETVSKTELKKATNGEVPPDECGFGIAAGTDEFYVKTEAK